MRLYRGLAEPYKPEKVGQSEKGMGNGTNFTNCPFAALAYANKTRGVLLVLDVPPEAESRITEALWLRDDAKRFIIYGRFDAFLVATLAAKELRADLRSRGMSKRSVSDGQRSSLLRYLIEERLKRSRVAAAVRTV